jgi:hypothetical protein
MGGVYQSGDEYLTKVGDLVLFQRRYNGFEGPDVPWKYSYTWRPGGRPRGYDTLTAGSASTMQRGKPC